MRIISREEAESGNWRMAAIWDAHQALITGDIDEATEILEFLLTDDFEEEEETWYLGNGEESHAANPETFYLPEEFARRTLEPGDHAKLMFMPEDGEGGERMWVNVEEVVDGGYIGSLINNPIFLPLEYGDPISFRPEHIIDIVSSEEMAEG